ncbi:MAG TPA: NAD(P) transhydrogenase subunit alpha [Gemmatimonadales bacterium]|nr:NAD(P) transhydrogenase subunit alpha [Gemmatimonadales bacterium]
MRIAVLRETAPHENRVALVPLTVQRLVKAGHEVLVQPGAGEGSFIPDTDYAAAGATLVPEAATLRSRAEILVAVQRPALPGLSTGTLVIGLLQPATAAEYKTEAGERGVTLLAMELVPRTTRAQAMDALSSQATVAGYAAVLLGAGRLSRLLPMLTTAAGTIPPAKVFVVGAGVAGLQAIASARRLGAVVSAFDVRPAVREEVQSLGATFVEADAVAAAAEGTGGYARQLGEEQQRNVLLAIGKHIPQADLVITTAQIPGKPAPRLITGAMVATMKPGSVIVDLAVESGGNCELSRLGEAPIAHGVTILGPVNLPATIPQHASLMYSRNLQNLLEYLIKDGRPNLAPDDPITGPMTVARGATAAT